MTEAEWLAEDVQPWDMPYDVAGRTSERKLRLAGCAICRQVWNLLIDSRSCRAVGVAERYADGRATEAELAIARLESEAASAWVSENGSIPNDHAAVAVKYLTVADGQKNEGEDGLDEALYAAAQADWGPKSPFAGVTKGLAVLLRCVFGNPFRPVTFSPEWRTSTAVALARQIYESRDFSAMPILADALQDAGCDSDDVLNHCRDESLTHVRGCWVVDLVLGKS